jgi:hypothetical protein
MIRSLLPNLNYHPNSSFADLNKDIPPPSTGKTEFFPCMIDPDSTIAWGKTIDPALAKLVADQGLTGKFDFPRVRGLRGRVLSWVIR